MKRNTQLLFGTLFLAFGIQSIAMFRLPSVARSIMASRGTAIRRAFKPAITVSSIGKTYNSSVVSRFFNSSATPRVATARENTPQYSKTRFVLAGSLGLTAAALALYEKPAKAEPEKPKVLSKIVPWQALKDQKIKELEAQENEIHKRILAFCGLSEEEWQKHVYIFYKRYADSVYKSKVDAYLEHLKHKIGGSPVREKSFEDTNVSLEVKEYIQKCLGERGIDSRSVDIVVDRHPQFLMNAFVKASLNKDFQTQYTIGISSDWHDGFTLGGSMREDFEGIMHHEIQHILHDDHFMTVSYAVLMLTAFKNKVARGSFDQGIAIYNSLNHFCEKRADILACLDGPEFALKLAHFFKNVLMEQASFTHPDSLARSEYCMDLYHQMKAYQDKSN